MSKFTLIILLSFSIETQCQEYYFNNAFVYKTNKGNFLCMTNDENPKYFFYTNYYYNGFKGVIIDFNTKIKHYFDIYKDSGDLKFNYQDSYDNFYEYSKSNWKKRKKSRNEFKKIDINDSTESIEVITLRIKKRKTKYTDKKAVFYFDKNEKKLLHESHIKHFFHSFIYSDGLPDYFGKLPKKIELKYSNKDIYTYTLKNKYEINTNLIVKKQNDE